MSSDDLKEITSGINYFSTSVLTRASSSSHLDESRLKEMFSWARYCQQSFLDPNLGPCLRQYADLDLARAPRDLYLRLLDNPRLSRKCLHLASRFYEVQTDEGDTFADAESRLCLPSRNDLKRALVGGTYLFPDKSPSHKKLCKVILYGPSSVREDPLTLSEVATLLRIDPEEPRLCGHVKSYCRGRSAQEIVEELETILQDDGESNLVRLLSVLEKLPEFRRDLAKLLHSQSEKHQHIMECIVINSAVFREEIKFLL